MLLVWIVNCALGLEQNDMRSIDSKDWVAKKSSRDYVESGLSQCGQSIIINGTNALDLPFWVPQGSALVPNIFTLCLVQQGVMGRMQSFVWILQVWFVNCALRLNKVPAILPKIYSNIFSLKHFCWVSISVTCFLVQLTISQLWFRSWLEARRRQAIT